MVKQGDIIMLDISPTLGSEQSGYRPAIVLSSNLTISKTKIISICPITSNKKRSGFNIPLCDKTKTQGVALCAHHRSVDLSVRPYKIVEQLPKDKLYEILSAVISTITPSE